MLVAGKWGSPLYRSQAGKVSLGQFSPNRFRLPFPALVSGTHFTSQLHSPCQVGNTCSLPMSPLRCCHASHARLLKPPILVGGAEVDGFSKSLIEPRHFHFKTSGLQSSSLFLALVSSGSRLWRLPQAVSLENNQKSSCSIVNESFATLALPKWGANIGSIFIYSS